ncbi:hypothetical protein EDB87DRAFT_1419773 [Lactarius vividus]|nr:hypothetical protein EDB87DRAFT_1419773 [Lactarius vividus]
MTIKFKLSSSGSTWPVSDTGNALSGDDLAVFRKTHPSHLCGQRTRLTVSNLLQIQSSEKSSASGGGRPIVLDLAMIRDLQVLSTNSSICQQLKSTQIRLRACHLCAVSYISWAFNLSPQEGYTGHLRLLGAKLCTLARERLPSFTRAMSSESRFKLIVGAALSKYQKKTGKSILSHPLAVELQCCSSIDAVLSILQRQSEAFEQFRGGDRRLMKGIGLSVHVLYALSATLGEGVGLAFPPAKVICSGIGILLAAAKDVRASHDALVDLFGRIEGFFKRLKVYTETSSTSGFAEVLVNVVVEVLNILSIATKEMEQSRAKTYLKKLVGRADIEDSLKRLDSMIREEHQAATGSGSQDDQ